MRILINTDPAFRNPTGMGNHARQLLQQIVQNDAQNDYTLLARVGDVWPPDDGMTALPDNMRVKAIAGDSRMRRYAERFGLCGGAVYDGLGDYDIYYEFSEALYPIRSLRRVATLHDVTLLTVPSSYAWHSHLLFRWAISGLRKADVVITVSETSRDAIASQLGISRQRIAVVYNGVDEQFWSRNTALAERVRVRYGLDCRFAIFVGVINRRKNLPTALRAFAELRRRHGLCPLQFVICGGMGIGAAEVFRECLRLGLQQEVKFLGHVSQSDLPALLQSADVLILPSLDEGFGMPIIEAMASGVPVVCSDIPVFREIVAGAALVFSPRDHIGMADALSALLSDCGLRRMLVERGERRSRDFTWRASFRALRSIFERLR